MPVISVTMGEGQATSQQKKDLIESFTTNAAKITGIPANAFSLTIAVPDIPDEYRDRRRNTCKEEGRHDWLTARLTLSFFCFRCYIISSI